MLADHCVSFAAIGGVSMGADPIVGGMIALGIERGYALRGFLIRKEPKGHGTNRYIEGPVRPGDKVVIVEDVSTTGASALRAIERCREFGLEPLCVVSVVDREQGADKAMPMGVPRVSLLRVSEIMEGMPCDSAVIMSAAA